MSKMTCPRRINELGPWKHDENLDEWREGKDHWLDEYIGREMTFTHDKHGNVTSGDGSYWPPVFTRPRTCSFCGGIHPDDAIELVKNGWRMITTGKNYKRYLHPPAGREPVPPVKLYVMHFTEEQANLFNEALRQKIQGDRV